MAMARKGRRGRVRRAGKVRARSRSRVEVVHLPDNKPEYNMPYVPAVKMRGGKVLFLSGVVAAPVYHHHPHRPEEFDHIPADAAAQARMALGNLTRVLEAAGGNLRDVVYATRFFTDLEKDQDAVNAVWKEFFGDHVPCITTVQIVRLGTDPRLRLEIAALAVVPD
ncbi:MAG: RidA family protein [candidate division NC10 bacterium]|nr:RidA family protein [Candidatus Rokubacteria bacterium]MBI2560842.1 RidA family protein [candidate division NC10 bacterium]